MSTLLRIEVSNGFHDFAGYVLPDVDLDGEFAMWDADEQEIVTIRGWQATELETFDITTLQDDNQIQELLGRMQKNLDM